MDLPAVRTRRPRGAEAAAVKAMKGRLRALGAGALSDGELLTLVVGRARVGSARDEGRRTPEELGSTGVGRLTFMSTRELERAVGAAGAVRLMAALELGRRAATEPLVRGRRIRGPADVHGLFGPRLRHLLQEEFHVILLDARHRLLATSLVTRGTADASLVHAREVFRGALQEGATAVILVHNHPSGDPSPSPEDRVVTRQLAQAGGVVGVPVLDHVIVGDGRYVSLAEEGGLLPA